MVVKDAWRELSEACYWSVPTYLILFLVEEKSRYSLLLVASCDSVMFRGYHDGTILSGVIVVFIEFNVLFYFNWVVI